MPASRSCPSGGSGSRPASLAAGGGAAPRNGPPEPALLGSGCPAAERPVGLRDGSRRGRRLESRGHRVLRPVTPPRPSATHACPGGPAVMAAGGLPLPASGAPVTARLCPRLRTPAGTCGRDGPEEGPCPPPCPPCPPRGLEDVTGSHGPRRWYSSRFRPSPPFARDEGGAAGSPVPGGALGSGPAGTGSDPGPGRRPPSGSNTPPSEAPSLTARRALLRMPAAPAPDWPSPVTWLRPCPAARAAGKDGRPCACGRRGPGGTRRAGGGRDLEAAPGSRGGCRRCRWPRASDS